MSKSYLTIAAAALAMTFAACSSDDLALNNDQQKAPQLEEGAVGFDVYTQKATTRGGWTGSLTTEKLKGGAGNADGFGVFGYYTDNNEYDQRSTPNFFYNQQVKWESSAWTYSPVKYWPNEYGTNAQSEDQDKVTYFAYAPWVEVVPTSGKLTNTDEQAEEWGITGMTRNSNQGDPILKYIASFNNIRSVDICWGVADNNDGVWPLTKEGKTQKIENGLPWIDVERPANTNQRVKFTFKHATAQMRVNIDAFVDGTNNKNSLDPKTRIWVREVTFKGFAMKGALNLHNEDENEPKWLDYGGQNELVAEGVTIYDGRKDGKEGVNGAIATNEKVTGLNPALIQDGLYEGNDWGGVSGTHTVYNSNDLVINGVKPDGATGTYTRPGVTRTKVDLFAQNLENANNETTGNSIFHVIPTDEDVEVEIVYDVETVSENLAQNLSDGATKGSSIENRITKKISFGAEGGQSVSRLEAGHSYTLDLHLGMNSVKFDAAVTPWVDVQELDIDLPLNVPAFAINTDKSVTIPFKGNYTFALNGLDGGESMTVTPGTNTINEGGATGKKEQAAGYITDWSATNNSANTSGVAIQTLNVQTNPGTTKQVQKVTWTGNQHAKSTEMTFTQEAHPLFMTISRFTNDSGKGKITLTRWNDESHLASTDWMNNYGWFCETDGKAITGTNGDPEAPTPTNGIAVYRNGTKLTWTETAIDPVNVATDHAKYNFTDANENTTAIITIGEKLQVGDVIKVVLLTGDAPIETVSATVGAGYYFSSVSHVVTYKATGTYDGLIPTYKGEGVHPVISYSVPDALVASINTSTGVITTADGGTVTVTASWAPSNPLDLGEDTYQLTVEPQNTEIDWIGVDTNIQTTSVTGNGDIILDADDLKALFKVKGAIDANPAGCSITEVTGTGSAITLNGGNLVVGASDLSLGDYPIDLTISGTGNGSKYNAPANKSLTLTVRVQ
jgi:hypothetical protein